MTSGSRERAVYWRGVAECHTLAPELEMYRWVWAPFSHSARPLKIPFVGTDGINAALINNPIMLGDGVAVGWCEGARIAVLFFADGGGFPDPVLDEIDGEQWKR